MIKSRSNGSEAPEDFFDGVSVSRSVIVLERMQTETGLFYRWTHHGEACSPILDTLQCAKAYGEKMPLLTKEQWIESDPNLEFPSNNQGS